MTLRILIQSVNLRTKTLFSVNTFNNNFICSTRCRRLTWIAYLRTVQENCCQPRPLTRRSLNSSNNSSRWIFLLSTVVRVDEVPRRFKRTVRDEGTGRLSHCAGNCKHGHQRPLCGCCNRIQEQTWASCSRTCGELQWALSRRYYNIRVLWHWTANSRHEETFETQWLSQMR